MKVTVIITTFQRTDFLIRAIDSVLASDYENFEVLVIDDNGVGSEFQLKNVQNLKKYSDNKKFVYHAMPKNGGACKARNQGAAIAKGEILMFLDDDDYYFENKISKHVEPLLNSDFDACLCAMKRMNENHQEIISKENYPRGEDLKSFILNGNCFTLMIAIKKTSFLKIGGFAEIPRFQDQLFMFNFYANKLKSVILNDQLFMVLEHNQNRISLNSIEKISQSYLKLFNLKKQYFYLFSKTEQQFLTNKYNFNQAYIRSNGAVLQRLEGLKYLLKSNLLFQNRKVFIKLVFSDSFINKVKPNSKTLTFEQFNPFLHCVF